LVNKLKKEQWCRRFVGDTNNSCGGNCEMHKINSQVEGSNPYRILNCGMSWYVSPFFCLKILSKMR